MSLYKAEIDYAIQLYNKSPFYFSWKIKTFRWSTETHKFLASPELDCFFLLCKQVSPRSGIFFPPVCFSISLTNSHLWRTCLTSYFKHQTFSRTAPSTVVPCFLCSPATPEARCVTRVDHVCPLECRWLAAEKAVCLVGSLVRRSSWHPVSAANICWVNTQIAFAIYSNKYVIPEADIS